MLSNIVREFVYKCPECGKTVRCEAGVFSLSGGYEGHCECGLSALKISKFGGKYRVTVPCGFCGESHSGSFSMMDMIRPATQYVFCPHNDKYACCFGAPGKMEKEIHEMERSFEEREEIKKAPDEYWNTPSARHGILQKMVAMLEGGAMACSCGHNRMQILLENGETFVRCEKCGGIVPMPTLDGITLEEYPEIEPILYKGPSNITKIMPETAEPDENS
jgi:hypothetical protein